MNRRDLVTNLADRLETDKRTADAHLQAVIDTITETVSKGEVVVISGFAKFARVDRPARMGRNPQTGEAIRIKASRRARVTPLKAFKDAVLSGKAPASTAAKKTAAKKTPAKKTAAKKTAAKKTAAKKTPAKKTVAKKGTARNTTARKTTR
jgi:DNA-binding protein HU-beta